jgi:periplasmic divalent cation tolerance protein
MQPCSLVYITAPNEYSATLIAKALVERKLAACVNILPGGRSFYSWQGELVEQAELVLFVKTTTENLPALMILVKELHEYDCPCILSFEINEGSREFLSWIQAAVGSEKC